MFKRFMAAVALLAASSAFGQQSTAELEKRLRDLEARVAQVDELKREIDVLTREIESMKVGEKRAVAADQTNYGFGVAASKVYRADVGVSFGGYGEFAYEKPQNGVAVADALRAVLYTGYKFNDRVLFNSELEVEHGSTESAGAVSSEFAYLDFLSRPQLNYRAGLMLMPMGLVNEQHEPTAYLTTHKAVTEQAIIPATWSELGAGVFGHSGPLSYRAYVVTGLRAGGFSPEEGLREGRQGGSEALAQHGAVVGRLDWHPIEGTFVGTSLYTGKTAEGFARVSIGEVHADSRFRGLTLRGVVEIGRAHV